MEHLIDRILDREGLRDLDRDFVKYVVNRKITEKVKSRMVKNNFFKSSEFRALLKEVRRDLRIAKGVFSKSKQKKIKEFLANGEFDKLLDAHISTKERESSYEEIFKDINELTANHFGSKKLRFLDLGCGINPVKAVQKLNNVGSYDAYDISRDNIDIVKEFFKVQKVKGDVKTANILKLKKYSADVVFMFKLLDVLEHFEKSISEKLIKNIDAKIIIISFAKVSIGGKVFRKARRLWLEKIISKYKFFKKDYGNELFYFVEK